MQEVEHWYGWAHNYKQNCFNLFALFGFVNDSKYGIFFFFMYNSNYSFKAFLIFGLWENYSTKLGEK